MIRKVAITLVVSISAALTAAASIDKRIIGGQDAKDGEFTSIVSIGDFCGGVLLDSFTVLTAAHCIGGSDDSVVAGTVHPSKGGVTAKVASTKRHPDFGANGVRTSNDIGILKLSTPIEKSEAIGYATLPENGSDPVVNSTAVAAGWGVHKPPLFLDSPFRAGTLGKVVVPVQPREYCSSTDPNWVATDKIVCAGGNGKNVCRGDSGGPLFDQETEQIIGIASFVARDPGFQWPTKLTPFCNLAPAVYTSVSKHLAFINANLGEPGSGSNPGTQTGELSGSNKLADLRHREEELCKDLGKSLDECRPQVAECVFQIGEQINTFPNENLAWEAIKECVSGSEE
ncbi:hypothetical protein NHJ6243_008368 [Beauveria neobassiana]